MVEIKILSASLRKRIQGTRSFKIFSGLNWIVGSGGSGKSSCLSVLKEHKNYVFKKEIKTLLSVPLSKILSVDFGYCVCSDKVLDDLFVLLREGGSGETSRLRFLELLATEAKKDTYEMILIDSPFYFVGDEHFAYVRQVLRDLSLDKMVVVTVNNSKLIGEGNRIVLSPSIYSVSKGTF
jgi:ABC-type hemin transport system ATPase subunit